MTNRTDFQTLLRIDRKVLDQEFPERKEMCESRKEEIKTGYGLESAKNKFQTQGSFTVS